jgi:predicted phosphohydrolase
MSKTTKTTENTKNTSETINKIQVYSDTHIELYKTKYPLIKPLAPLLILCGDIGLLSKDNFISFLNYVSKNWKYIIYVPGNHEYYIKDMPFNRIRKKYNKIMSQFKNIIYLDNGYWDLDGIRYIGSTLWSNPDFVKNRCDFKEISELDNDGKLVNLKLDTFKQMHQECIQFIKKILEKSKNESIKKIIVLTHFPPLIEGTNHPKYDDSPYTKYFANDFLEMGISTKNINLWISGHTHYSYNIQKHNCRFFSNQMGYPDEKIEDTRFNLNEKSVIDLSTI